MLIAGRFIAMPYVNSDAAEWDVKSREGLGWNDWLLFFQHLHNACVMRLTVDYLEPFLTLLTSLLNVGRTDLSPAQQRPRIAFTHGGEFQLKVGEKIALGLYKYVDMEYFGQWKIYGEDNSSLICHNL